MYIIINSTTGINTSVKGNFPLELIVAMLENDDDVIIISLYSNTIKVPYVGENVNYNETKSGLDWEFKDYNYSLLFNCRSASVSKFIYN